MSHPDPGACAAAELSVVIALVSGDPRRLRSCLEALRMQESAPAMEILVPYDEPVAAVRGLAPDFPEARFILADHLDTAAARAGASREHHDSIRTVGLKSARGSVIAMIEDVGTPGAHWARSLLDAMQANPEAGAIGGGMVCGSGRLLNRAVCACDFYRYDEPVPAGNSGFATDANIAYRKTAMEAIRDRWESDYHEPVVNTALRRHGYEIRLTGDATVSQTRGRLGWGEALRERYVWGRSFAGTRVRDTPLTKRLVYAGFTPLLPFVTLARISRVTIERSGISTAFVAATPAIFLLGACWAIGEAVGYLSGRPD